VNDVNKHRKAINIVILNDNGEKVDVIDVKM